MTEGETTSPHVCEDCGQKSFTTAAVVGPTCRACGGWLVPELAEDDADRP